MTTEEQFNLNEDIKVYRKQEDESWKEIPAELTDEQLDSAIENALASPEVSAMLENAAADARSDAVIEAITKDALSHPRFDEIRGGLRPDYITFREFKAFEARVAAAFKHAGFKF